MRQSLSWQANKSWVGQEIPRILQNRKVHCHIHNSPSPGSILRQARGIFERFETCKDLRGVVSTSPNPQAGRPHLVGCPRLPTQYIHSCPPYWRPFLLPHPQYAPYSGNRGPLNGFHQQRLQLSSKYCRHVSKPQTAGIPGTGRLGFIQKVNLNNSYVFTVRLAPTAIVLSISSPHTQSAIIF